MSPVPFDPADPMHPNHPEHPRRDAEAVPPVFDSLDQILTEEAAKVTAWGDVRANSNGMAADGMAAWTLENRLEAFAGHEERLAYLLGALAELVGSAVLLEVREQVAGMLVIGRALHQAASTAEGSWQGAQIRLGEVLEEREASRRTATLLEAALEHARDRVEVAYGPDAAAAAFDAEFPTTTTIEES